MSGAAERSRLYRISRGQPKVRKCRRCGAPASSSRSWYCATCRAVSYARRKGAQAAHGHEKTRQQRGYGADHDRTRKRWARLVAAGGVVCGYCGGPIDPGDKWDLSHPLDRKDLEPVPWHRSENRHYAASVTAPRRRGNQPRLTPAAIANTNHGSPLGPASSEPPAVGGVYPLEESEPAPELPRPGVVYVICLKCGTSEPEKRDRVHTCDPNPRPMPWTRPSLVSLNPTHPI